MYLRDAFYDQVILLHPNTQTKKDPLRRTGASTQKLRFKNLSVLKYLLHGKTTVFPTPFVFLEPHTVHHPIE